MTDDKKHDDKDRKKLSDEEMEDVAGGVGDRFGDGSDDVAFGIRKDKKGTKTYIDATGTTYQN